MQHTQRSDSQGNLWCIVTVMYSETLVRIKEVSSSRWVQYVCCAVDHAHGWNDADMRQGDQYSKEPVFVNSEPESATRTDGFESSSLRVPIANTHTTATLQPHHSYSAGVDCMQQLSDRTPPDAMLMYASAALQSPLWCSDKYS
jgi:hypothetical protein